METSECLQCERLREAYRRATRNELDLMILRDEAELRRDSKNRHELSDLITAATEARASACKRILDHEDSHGKRLSAA